MRLIDANRAMEIVRDQRIAHPNAYHLTNYATLILQEAPTVDAVEVVRCRDCKHSDDGCHKDGLRYCMRGIKADDYNETGYIYPVEEVVRDVDYCSYGERRTEENGDS